ncbi:MAG TPA: helix-turn-helix transcriptional regulator [Urbifossiella sp.]|nr:helix-turn-helix transcriptional regulator [Urbifossiella sp.]
MDAKAYKTWLDGVRERVKAARDELKLSLRAAADLTGVPFKSIHRVEASDFVPTLEVLYRLAVGYGVTVGALLCEEETAKPRGKKK